MNKLQSIVESIACIVLGALYAGPGAVMAHAAATGSLQDYPAKPLRIVTGAPGSTAEFTARVIGQGLSEAWAQPAIVDPRSTGGATVFGEIVARATPDGYTLLIIGSTLWLGPLFRSAPYDALKDFSFIAILTDSPNILVVNPSLPVNSVKELIAYARAKPRALNYSTSGIGASPHLAAELFKSMTMTDIMHVPYKGAGASVIALMSGEAQLSFASAASVTAQIKAGKLRAIAVTGTRPYSVFADLPTVASTVPGYEAGAATGFFAPARTPSAIINRLNREAQRLLARADVKAKFLATGAEAAVSTPQQLATLVRADTAKWRKVIRDAGIAVSP
jgi:tripartite-type tricarboxylate transporter receptor subunit TctC